MLRVQFELVSRRAQKTCVTSRSGALTKLILWGHSLASHLDFMMMNHLTLMMMRHDWWQDVLLLLYTGAIDSVSLSVQGFRPWGCRGIDETPLDSGLSQGVGYLGCFIYSDIALFWWYAIDFMICCWHDLTWWLMMQADDSLPTRLTYGVKGPHTSSREIEGEVWTATLP